MRYFFALIRSFSDKDTEKVWREVRARRWPTNLRRAALRKFILLHTAERLEDLLFPPGIVWRKSGAIEKDSTASGSTTSGAFVSAGQAMTLKM